MLKFLNGRLLGTCIDDPAPAPAPGGGVPAPAPVAGDKPWHDGFAAEDIGYFQNRGTDKGDAKAAALAASRAHREAEKLIGAPAAELIRLPKDPNDTAGWTTVRERLGVPKDANGYADAFKVIKHADGSDLKAEEVAAWGKKAHTLGLRPSDALTFVNESIKESEAAKAAGTVEEQGKLAAQKTALATNWGTNFDANMFVAKQTAGVLGVTPEQVAALESVVGYDKVMEMFRNIGSKIGEDRFVLNPANPSTGAMTKEQAVERKAALMADQVWTAAYLAGDTTKRAEMRALNVMIVGTK